jgi:uncharacterized coiled-coil protein SlyX
VIYRVSFTPTIWLGLLHYQNWTLHILYTMVAHTSKKCPKVKPKLRIYSQKLKKKKEEKREN